MGKFRTICQPISQARPTGQPAPTGIPYYLPTGQEFCDRGTTVAFLKRKAFWNTVRRIMFSETQGIPVPVGDAAIHGRETPFLRTCSLLCDASMRNSLLYQSLLLTRVQCALHGQTVRRY